MLRPSRPTVVNAVQAQILCPPAAASSTRLCRQRELGERYEIDDAHAGARVYHLTLHLQGPTSSSIRYPRSAREHAPEQSLEPLPTPRHDVVFLREIRLLHPRGDRMRKCCMLRPDWTEENQLTLG